MKIVISARSCVWDVENYIQTSIKTRLTTNMQKNNNTQVRMHIGRFVVRDMTGDTWKSRLPQMETEQIFYGA